MNGGALLPEPMPPLPGGGGVVVAWHSGSFMSTLPSPLSSIPLLHDSGGTTLRLWALSITTESRMWSLVSAMASFM